MKKQFSSNSTSIRLSAFTFFWDLVFVYAIDKLLFLDRGIPFFQIAILMSIWAAANVIFEIPSGILADSWNRKHLLIISAITRILLCVAWFFATTFTGFLIGFIFLAISQSFLSGTAQAYLHDSLRLNKQENKFEKLWGKVEASRLFGLSIAWAVGGLVSTASYTPALSLSIASGFICLFIALSLPNISSITKASDENPIRHLTKSLFYAFNNKMIARVFLFSMIVSSSYIIIDEYWAVFFDSLHYSPSVFGILVAISTLSGGVAGLFAHRFKKNAWGVISAGIIAFSTILISVFFSQSWLIIILMLSLELITGIMFVLTEGQIQQYAANDKRATIASVASFLKQTGIITGIAFGWVVSNISLEAGYLFFAMLVLLYFPITWLLNLKKFHQN